MFCIVCRYGSLKNVLGRHDKLFLVVFFCWCCNVLRMQDGRSGSSPCFSELNGVKVKANESLLSVTRVVGTSLHIERCCVFCVNSQ